MTIFTTLVCVGPLIAPTHQQVGETCDNIVAQAANPILEKLCFCVINPSQWTQA
jgi:hypothetical protein